ncbi:MAG: BrnT family toxin [Acidobacteriota bacterium]
MIEWDDAKDRLNFTKHGLRFEDAEKIFEGPCISFEDRRFDYGEERFITLGSLEGRVVVVVHVFRGLATRVISMRKANSRERQHYKERLTATRRPGR